MQGNKLTLQTFEVLFEQLRYDDAKKFLGGKRKYAFSTTLIDGTVYMIYASDKATATNKLVSLLDKCYRIQYVIDNCYSSHPYKYCNICCTKLQREEVEFHYQSHTEIVITKYLLKLDWFEQNSKARVIEC